LTTRIGNCLVGIGESELTELPYDLRLRSSVKSNISRRSIIWAVGLGPAGRCQAFRHASTVHIRPPCFTLTVEPRPKYSSRFATALCRCRITTCHFDSAEMLMSVTPLKSHKLLHTARARSLGGTCINPPCLRKSRSK